MSQGMTILLIVLIVVIGVAMIAALLVNNRREQKKRTISIIFGQASLQDGQSGVDERDRRRADMARKLQEKNGGKSKKREILRGMLLQAGLGDVPIKKFYVTSAIFAVVSTVLVKLTGQSNLVLLLYMITAFLGMPRWFLKFKAARRQKKFLEDFADALDAMVRLLKAGMPVGEAISMVAREFTGPVGEEMAKVYDEQKIGIPLAEACLHAAERMPLTEVKMFATGIAIQQQTGSSLSEILTNLSKVIRARFRLRRKVQALSAEAKASAMIIGSLPVVVALGLYVINPKYMAPLLHTMQGQFWLAGAVGWMCVGILIMRQMINFRI